MGIYEHKQEFILKNREVDFKDEMKVSAGLSFMEEVAGSSADELGFGYKFTKSKNCAFFVSAIRCEFLTPVYYCDAVKVVTWPLPPSHVVFEREYRFYDKNGAVAVNASSRWCLVDTNTGKILPSKTIEGQDYSTYNTARVFENVDFKVPAFALHEGEQKYAVTIANSEYDHNLHVNNTRYADYCMNCFSVDELKKNRVKDFTIAYVKQCKEGDTLRFYRKETEKDAFLVQGVNGADEVVVRASITFKGIQADA